MDSFKELIIASIVIVVLILSLVVGAYILTDPPTCEAQTIEIGYPHEWGFWSGCMIEVHEGQWIPLENYRFFGE